MRLPTCWTTSSGRLDDPTSGMADRLRHGPAPPVQRRPSSPRGAGSGTGRTASNIAGATDRALARETHNIVAVKAASRDFAQIMASRRDRPTGFRVPSGDDALTLPLIALGADGIISLVTNEAPDLMVKLT